jgi:hypothetical protein
MQTASGKALLAMDDDAMAAAVSSSLQIRQRIIAGKRTTTARR